MRLGLSLAISQPRGPAAPFTPASVTSATLSMWHRADLGVTLNAGKVSAWADQSGVGDSNRNLTQSTAGQQPIFYASDANFNGQAVIGTTAATDEFRILNSGTLNPTIAIPAWKFWCFRIPTGAASYFVGCIGTGGSNANTHGMNVTDSELLTLRDTSTLNSATLSFDTTYIVAARYNGASSKVYVNRYGTATTSGSLSGDTESSVAVGTLSGLNSQYRLAEMIEYDGDLSAADLQSVVQYMGTRYGVTVIS